MSSDPRVVGPHLDPPEGVKRAIIVLSLAAQELAIEGVDGYSIYVAMRGITVAVGETVQERAPELLPILDAVAYENVLPHARRAIRIVEPGDSVPEAHGRTETR